MIITSNGRSQQTPSAKGGKWKILRLDRVSCPDMEIQVLPNLKIAVDWVSCPDKNIGVLTTRFPRASCFKETHAFCFRNIGVHEQCTCAKKLVSSNFAKIIHNYIRKKICSVVWLSVGMFGGVPRARMFRRFIITTPPKKVQFFGGINWWHSRTPIRCLPGKRIIYISILRKLNAIIFLLNWLFHSNLQVAVILTFRIDFGNHELTRGMPFIQRSIIPYWKSAIRLGSIVSFWISE